MGRLREKYAAKMADGPDQRAFEVVMGGLGTNSAEFRDVARLVASVDTLDGFLRDMQARYPEMTRAAGGDARPAASRASRRRRRSRTASRPARSRRANVPQPVPSRHAALS